MARSKTRDDRPPLMRFLGSGIVLPAFGALANIRVHGGENLPRTGPIIVVANHMTEIDPLVVAIALYRLRRGPRFMAKDSLFKIPVVGKALTGTGQIPVERRAGGGDAMKSAKEALAAGGTVVVYPEGTLTRDPDLWPMVGRTGAVRLAWEAGVPVIPLAHWGAQNLLGRYETKLHWRLPRTRIDVQVGKPVALQKPAGGVHDQYAMEAATTSIMHAVTAELETLRGPKPSSELWTIRSVPKSALTPRGLSGERN